MNLDELLKALGATNITESCEGDCSSCDCNEDADVGMDDLLGVLQEALDQVANGKGNERHGNGMPLYEQPWLAIADTAGNGFLTGQAIKKLMEASSLVGKEGYTGSAFERELLGAIAYTAFAIMHQRLQDGRKEAN